MHCCRWRAVALLGITVALTACAGSTPHTLRPQDSSVTGLRAAVSNLAPSVSQREAERLAERAHTASRALALRYRAVGSPHFHNFLVNVGVMKRGLCYEWTEDLMSDLFTLHLTTLELHWGTAHGGTWREHNSVVITARGQPFRDGIVLDAWRYSGRLFWSPLAADHYPWREEQDSSYIRRAQEAGASRAAAETRR